MSDIFCCPDCEGPLAIASMGFLCRPCGRSFEIVNGIADFFVSESGDDLRDDPNIVWLDPKIVEARDTV